jgi:hypothetical protein
MTRTRRPNERLAAAAVAVVRSTGRDGPARRTEANANNGLASFLSRKRCSQVASVVVHRLYSSSDVDEKSSCCLLSINDRHVNRTRMVNVARLTSSVAFLLSQLNEQRKYTDTVECHIRSSALAERLTFTAE